MKFYSFKTFFVLLLLLISYSNLNASHIVGGQIYYDYLGNNQYKIYVEVFRDCNPSNAAFDDPLKVSIYANNNVLFGNYSFSSPVITPVNPNVNDPCIIIPNNYCVERALYERVITLPDNQIGYYISHQRCCWAANITNLVNPDASGITLTTNIPSPSQQSQVENNSARFINLPQTVLCANTTIYFNHAASDSDSDSLVYELVPPFYGATNTNSAPTTMTTAPYGYSVLQPNYSAIVPFGLGSSLTLDTQTGYMAFTPSAVGNYVVCVAVHEYRNGVKINTVYRTFAYRVVECETLQPPIVDFFINSIASQGNDIIEGCGSAGFVITRTSADDTESFNIEITGTASSGTDYEPLPNSVVLNQGVYSDTVFLNTIVDSQTEGIETLILSVIVPHPCNGTIDTISVSLNIYDYFSVHISTVDTVMVCDEVGDIALLWGNVSGGVQPYLYDWEPGVFLDNDSILVSSVGMQDGINVYNLNVTDFCGHKYESKPILVYNQCPVWAPNVLTINGDGVNETFVVPNLSDYESVEISIHNRWGNTIYHNSKYDNSWNGKDENGKDLSDGVYFYIITPNSSKYEYRDKKPKNSIHGFFHIIRK